MRLRSIQIQNFRSFLDQTIRLDDYTCFVGPNGAGKSCILTALNVFFRSTASPYTNLQWLAEEDFHHRNTGLPVKIGSSLFTVGSLVRTNG
ncbi:MAG: ATP-dependent endonuclease [Phycisphaerae bacterium]